MRLHQLGEAGEAEIEVRHLAGIARGAEPLLGMAPVNPARGKRELVGGTMVVKQAFGRMQYLRLLDAARTEHAQQVFEVSCAGLVGADVLGRADRVELDAELAVAEGEALV